MQTGGIARARPIFSHPHMVHSNITYTLLPLFVLILENSYALGQCMDTASVCSNTFPHHHVGLLPVEICNHM